MTLNSNIFSNKETFSFPSLQNISKSSENFAGPVRGLSGVGLTFTPLPRSEAPSKWLSVVSQGENSNTFEAC